MLMAVVSPPPPLPFLVPTSSFLPAAISFVPRSPVPRQAQAWKDGHKRACTPIRFEVGARVLCKLGALKWAKGRVVRHSYEEPEGVFHPYQVRLDDGALIFASQDHDGYIQNAFAGAGPLSRDAQGRLEEAGRLHDAQDWRGAVAMGSEALAIAREVQKDWPQLAAEVHEMLGTCYYSTWDYGRARELHEQHRAMAEALGDRARG